MMNKIDNENGFTFIGVMALLFILMSFSSMLITSTHYFNKNQYAIREDRNIKEVSSNKILELYATNNWSGMPNNEVIQTSSGAVRIDYSYSRNIWRRTEELDILFSHNSKQKDYTLKRVRRRGG